jgi:hypothetical protein
MRFTLSAVLALGSFANYSNAFVSPAFKTKSMTLSMSKEDEPEEGSGSTRFREMLEAAKKNQGQQMARPIDNPFLTPAASTPTAPANPDELSVEEQARLFREMMAGKQEPPPVKRVSREDRAGRPVGRNPDADKISNTSDLYFAQLKRDSTVRTLARQREDYDTAEAVFRDDGIKELDNLLQTNPHLQGQKDEERAILDKLPDEIVAPYFKSTEVDKDVLASAGVSYKKKLEERKKKTSEESTPAPAPKQEVAEVPKVEETPPPTPVPEPEPVVASQAPAPVEETPVEERPFTVTSSSDVRRQNLRTLMGLILKHRGGPGFGKGRLKGPDVDLFENLADEVTNMLRDEAKDATPAVTAAATPVVEAAPVQAAPVVEVAPVQTAPAETPVAASAEPANIDSTIACIEGAITMYKNSPPAIQESVLVTLRAALMSAVDTCNVALAGQPAPPIAPSADASIDGMVACIEGAVTMYKNSPPALKESVLVTLRMALMSAVDTCNTILSPGQAVPAPAAPQDVPAAAAAPSSQAPPAPSAPATDENSKALKALYDKLEAASGDGSLGLRSDLTADEASELADQLVAMRGILMQELETGIPGAKSAEETSSTVSRYEEMLAKAKAAS